MRAQAQTGTAPERAVLSALHQRGLRYRKHLAPVPSVRCKADAVFAARRVAVFVDGCFWHGCPIHGSWPKANEDWWKRKIAMTRARDHRNNEILRNEGWTVLRVWEHEDPQSAADRIAATIRAIH